MQAEVKAYSVKGSKGDIYTITDTGTEWTCTCPHHTHRKVECKHIKEVKEHVTRIKNGTNLREQNELWLLEKLIVAGMITENEVITQIKRWGYEQGRQAKVVNEQCERIRNYFLILRKDIEIEKRVIHNKKVRGLMDKFHLP